MISQYILQVLTMYYSKKSREITWIWNVAKVIFLIFSLFKGKAKFPA